jgi:hypothetical protein
MAVDLPNPSRIESDGEWMVTCCLSIRMRPSSGW